MLSRQTIFFLFAVLSILSVDVLGQSIPKGFNYQTTLRDNIGNVIPNHTIDIRFSIYKSSATGTLVWQEIQPLMTDSNGHIRAVVGMGINTGNSSLASFDQIQWNNDQYFLNVSVDMLSGAGFVDHGTQQLISVPYSFYSKKAQLPTGFNLAMLHDVSLAGLNSGNLLKWDGGNWSPGIDIHSDSVLFAYSVNHSQNTDTAMYWVSSTVPDSIQFSFISDTSNFSGLSVNSNFSSESNYSDTAFYALHTPVNGWLKQGNSGLNNNSYLGTNDNSGLSLITNNAIRASVSDSGSFNVNNSLSRASLVLNGNDGVHFYGNADGNLNTVSGAGVRFMYFPARGALRAGAVSGNQWDTINMGNYSTAMGYNNTAGDWSFSSGYNNQVLDGSLAIGSNNRALGAGLYPEGGCIALGDSNTSSFRRTVTIGKNNVASGSAAIAIGYNNIANGNTGNAFGSYSSAGGTRSVALGYRAYAVNTGAFIFSDISSNANVTSNFNHQFKVRASGGVVFYTDSMQTMGVVLNPGSGSWSVISDKNKKENFQLVDYQDILNKINFLKIKTWNYSSQDRSIRHIGPMAQDFYKVFNVGENDLTITSSDIDGVILSGIKAIDNKLEKFEFERQIQFLNSDLNSINDFMDLEKRLNAIETSLNDISKGKK